MLRKLALLISICLAPVLVSAQTHPVAFISAGQDAIYAQMKTDYEANTANPATAGGKWYKLIKNNAECNCRYWDLGQWDAFMYHFTGTASYAVAAQAKIIPAMDANHSLDGRRSIGPWGLVIYDWIYQGLSAGQRTALLDSLNSMATYIDTQIAGVFSAGYWKHDSDQVVGDYVFIAGLNAATGGYNATIATIWGHAFWGGYDSAYTTYPPTTLRDTLTQYAAIGAGGEWIESSVYNISTFKYLMFTKAIDDWTAGDHFNDLDAIILAAATQLPYHFSPDLLTVYQWGDSEHPDDLMLYYRIEQLMVFSGLNKGNSAGQYAQAMIQDLMTKYPGVGQGNPVDPYGAGFFVYDPYLSPLAVSGLPLKRFTTGWQLFTFKESWTDTASAYFNAHFAPEPWVDHSPAYWGAWKLYNNGEWVFDHPIGYAGPSLDARGTSGLSIAGVPIIEGAKGPREYKVVTAQEHDATNGFVYITGTAGGNIYGSGFAIPPTFVMENTRSIVYVPALDAVVVHDRSSANDGRIDGFDSAYAQPKTWMQSRPYLKELYVATPVNPNVGTAGVTSWATVSNGTAKVFHLLPTSITRTVENEATVFADGTYGTGYWNNGASGPERKYHVIVSPSADNKWDTFLNVWHHYSSTAVTPTLVQDTSNKVDAVLLARSGTNYLLAFNAIQGPDLFQRIKWPDCSAAPATCWTYDSRNPALLATVRIRNSSYSLSFTGPTGGTKAVLFDLDTGTTWDYKINAGAAQDLTVDSSGVGVVDISATGAVTLEVIAAGTLPVSITTASLPSGRVGTAYSSSNLAATGGDGGPYTWSKTAGSYPTSVSASAGGVWSGTPTVAGTFNFTMEACDSQPVCATRALSILISDIPGITTSSLPNGTVNTPYSQTIAGTGGSTPYTFTVFSGALCDGLSLAANGDLTGTPTMVETCSFVIRLTDNAAATDDQALQIGINASAPGPEVTVIPGSRSVIVAVRVSLLYYDSYNTSCTVDLLPASGNIASVSNVIASGLATRLTYFDGLFDDTTYGIRAYCETGGTSETVYFTTPKLVSGTVSWPIKLIPSPILVAKSVAHVTVEYNLVGAGVSSVNNSNCAAGCTVTLSLASGGTYEVRHIWKTAADAVVATSRLRTIAVP